MQRSGRWPQFTFRPLLTFRPLRRPRRPRYVVASSITIADQRGVPRITLQVDDDRAVVRLTTGGDPSLELVAHATPALDGDPAFVTLSVRSHGDEVESWDFRAPE